MLPQVLRQASTDKQSTRITRFLKARAHCGDLAIAIGVSWVERPPQWTGPSPHTVNARSGSDKSILLAETDSNRKSTRERSPERPCHHTLRRDRAVRRW